MNIINVALVGCGFFGQQLASAFNKSPAQLVGVTDLQINLAQNIAEKYRIQAYADLNTLLSQQNVDLVLIATYNYSHRHLAEIAIQKGCAVFIETPFTINEQDAHQLIQIAKENNVPLFVGHCLRVLPGLQQAKQLLEQQVLGKLTVVRANRQRWINPIFQKDWWKNNIQLTGGKLFHEIHELDLLTWLVGDVESVFAQSTNRAHLETPDHHDIIQLLLQFKNGVFGSLEMGTAYRLPKWDVTIHGELGSMMINFFTSSVTLTFANGKREHFNIYNEFEADLSLRESSKGIQKYGQPNEHCPYWITRAIELEAESVFHQLLTQQPSVLAELPAAAIYIASAANESMQNKFLTQVRNFS
ncbi:Gfo/Idh/MocA family oxidoreductase [Avibacterium sp. 21-595]|uniref:Gfo/Idh/MocA family protein n=1 Tax=Avibacterium sp. 21-595 TaxID=2911527 RepID=UPI002026C7A1|nr:Gfo/Idh/MocA family oxidoreductase [Avibacterium sp. 21-595]URL06048.1 Gfo/Idh/MocA family oxidoreductase [Avibacterium sp. 21-595]